ncbi:MAG: hypothetical protein GH144_00120 [Clostridia bacterium]|jgi:hypothetical protein|nr:hypothetical protein [Clostridia bacterium]
MRGTTIKLTLDRADLGVVGSNSTAAVWSTIVDITVPAGLAYVLYNHAPFVIKLAATGNVALGRNGEIIIGFKGAGDSLVKELYKWDYGIFYDLTIANQRNKNYRDQIAVTMPWPYVIVREDEHLLLQVKHATAVVIAEVLNVIEFNVNKVIMA